MDFQADRRHKKPGSAENMENAANSSYNLWDKNAEDAEMLTLFTTLLGWGLHQLQGFWRILHNDEGKKIAR